MPGSRTIHEKMAANPEKYYGKAEYCGVPVTKRQKALLDYMHSYFSEHNTYPSYREICIAMGVVSPNALANHIRGLVNRGLVAKQTGKIRPGLILTKFRPMLIPADRYEEIRELISGDTVR